MVFNFDTMVEEKLHSRFEFGSALNIAAFANSEISEETLGGGGGAPAESKASNGDAGDDAGAGTTTPADIVGLLDRVPADCDGECVADCAAAQGGDAPRLLHLSSLFVLGSGRGRINAESRAHRPKHRNWWEEAIFEAEELVLRSELRNRWPEFLPRSELRDRWPELAARTSGPSRPV